MTTNFNDEFPRAVSVLNGPWLYKLDPNRSGEDDGYHTAAADRGDWLEMTIPANWYRTEVGDYHGVVWFARSIVLDDLDPDSRYFVRFNAVDYICEAWVNGCYLGRHEGFFAPFEFDVTNSLQEGVNLLAVKVDSPFDDTEFRAVERPDLEGLVSEDAGMKWPVDLKVIKGAMIHFYHRPGWETRFGQDGNTGGIWQSVELIKTGNLKIENVKIYPMIVRRNGTPDGTAILSMDIDISNGGTRATKARVAIEATGKNFDDSGKIIRTRKVTLTPGPNRVKLVCTVDDPVFWWSWDLGDPNLYEMIVSVAAGSTGDGEPAITQDCVTETFGIRELEIDDKGQWILNGTRIFARGMRYLSSIWFGDGNEEMFREDLARMKKFHINSVRIGSHVEKPGFYDICDEMGLLVWQVFPLHYAYGDSDDVIERAAPMMAEMVRSFYNHPSIVVWSVFKEPDVYGLDNPPNNYGRLCQIMYEAGSSEDPIRWVHTGDYHEGAQHLMTGITLPGEMDFRTVTLEPQVVEFGSGAMPPMETVNELLEPQDRWPPNWDKWFYLNADPRWFKWEGVDVDQARSVEELVEATQTWSARQIKESAEYLRQRKHNPVSSMYLYYWNDPYPCLFGSGVLDFDRREYKSYDMFSIIYTPVLVSIEWLKGPYFAGYEKNYNPGEDIKTNIWITNDTYADHSGAKLTLEVVDEGDHVLYSETTTVNVAEDSSTVVKEFSWMVPPDKIGRFRMTAVLETSGGQSLSRNYFEFVVAGE